MTNSATSSTAVAHRARRRHDAQPADRTAAGHRDDDVQRPMKGILLGVLLGAACWAMAIGLLIVW